MSDDKKCPHCGGTSGYGKVEQITTVTNNKWTGETIHIVVKNQVEIRAVCIDCARRVEDVI